MNKENYKINVLNLCSYLKAWCIYATDKNNYIMYINHIKLSYKYHEYKKHCYSLIINLFDSLDTTSLDSITLGACILQIILKYMTFPDL